MAEARLKVKSFPKFLVKWLSLIILVRKATSVAVAGRLWKFRAQGVECLQLPSFPFFFLFFALLFPSNDQTFKCVLLFSLSFWVSENCSCVRPWQIQWRFGILCVCVYRKLQMMSAGTFFWTPNRKGKKLA